MSGGEPHPIPPYQKKLDKPVEISKYRERKELYAQVHPDLATKFDSTTGLLHDWEEARGLNTGVGPFETSDGIGRRLADLPASTEPISGAESDYYRGLYEKDSRQTRELNRLYERLGAYTPPYPEGFDPSEHKGNKQRKKLVKAFHKRLGFLAAQKKIHKSEKRVLRNRSGPLVSRTK